MAHKSEEREVGFLVGAKQYVLSIEGLPSARINDIVADREGNRALVRALADDHIVALALDPVYPRVGEEYSFLPHPHLFSLGEHLFGRVVNALGEPFDGKESFPPGNQGLALDVDAPGIDARVTASRQLHTGVTLVDTLLPIAMGQRQLIYGQGHGGKTTFLIDAVRYQRERGTICIYAILGKPLAALEHASRTLLANGGTNTIVLAALSDQPPPRIAIAPSVAYLIADHFQRKGRDVLIVLDNLDVHAKYLREVALLEGRLPGRESYPGDLFYQHAHLLERSGCFTKELGGGTITSLPVAETDIDSFSNIIYTNLMACTDGHLSFLSALRAEGVYPAVSEEQSVTRLGRKVQPLVQKQLSARIRMLLGIYRERRAYSQFGAEPGGEVQESLREGESIEYVLRQEPGNAIAPEAQVPLLALTLTPFAKKRDVAFFERNTPALVAALSSAPEFAELRTRAMQDITLDEYLSLVERAESAFVAVCRE